MAKPTFSVGGLTFEQAAAVNTFLAAGAPGAVGGAPPPPPAAPAAPPMASAPPMATAPAMPGAPPATPAAPPPAAPPAAPPPPAAPAAPAASGLDTEVAKAVTKLAAKDAKAAMAIIEQATATHPDGDPKKGSKRFQDIPEAYKQWVINECTAKAG